MSETNSTRRAIPHINHTPELEAAAIAVTHGTDGKGNPVNLCANPLDPLQVRDAMAGIGDLFEDPTFFFEGESSGAVLAAVENLILLASLLRAHLRAGNTL